MFDHLKSLIYIKPTAFTITTSQLQQKSNPAHLIVDTQETLIAHGDAWDAKEVPVYKGLERYRLLEKLGDGAFSNVYKAFDLETNLLTAVKAVRKHELTQHQRANVLKEVQLMRGMDHPSIVKLLNFIETPEHYFLVLELCEGGELFHRIVDLTYFSEDLSRHCIRQVAEAIRYLHQEKGIVHRDIKPENLLFEPVPFMDRTSTNPAPPPPSPSPSPPSGDDDDDDEPKVDEGEFVEGHGGGGIGRVKIADFGLSKVVWDLHTRTPCGTVGYTAPEIVREERYNKSVDMWALGCVLYTLLCGFPPFYEEDTDILTEKIAHADYSFLSPWWDGISDQAKHLVSCLLRMDPEDRYTIDQFFTHPWMQQGALSAAKEAREKATASADQSEDDDDERSTTSASSSSSTTTTADTEAAETSESAPSSAASHDTSELASYIQKKQQKQQQRHDLFPVTGIKDMLNVSYALQRINHEKAVGPINTYDLHPSKSTCAASEATTTSNSTAALTSPLVVFELDMNNATLLGRRRRSTTAPNTLLFKGD